MRRASLFAAWICSINLILLPVHACTIFVLSDTNNALFCNNEDWSNAKTRIWFIPATTNSLGCGMVGFDNGWAQGGINTKGLAFDWVAGSQAKWEKSPSLKPARGNPTQRMLETCATVEDAIAFYQKFWEPGFSYARVMVADRTGASAIIRSENGTLTAQKSNKTQGFGYGGKTLQLLLASNVSLTSGEGFRILRACKQNGAYATKYQNVFDLQSGDLFLLPTADDNEEPVKLNLASELAKGGHYYDLPQIRKQLEAPTMALLNNMRRFSMDDYKPIADSQPQLTAHVRAMLLDAINSTAKQKDYTPEIWAEVESKQQETATELKAFGDLVSLTLVDRQTEKGKEIYRYRVEFAKTVLLQQVSFDNQERVTGSETEDFMWKETAPTP